MNKLTYFTIAFLFIFGFQRSGKTQDSYSLLNTSDQEFEENLTQDLTKLNSKDRFDYVSSLLDLLISNRVDRIVLMNELYSSWCKSNEEYALLNLSKGCYMFRTGNVDSAVVYLENSSEVLRENGRFQLSSESYNELGNAYFTGGDFNMAVDSYLNSLKVGHESDDETAKFNALLGLGRSYCAAGDTVIGVKLFNEYLKRSEEFKKMEASSDACGALAVIYQDIGDAQMADYYYKKGLDFSSKSESKSMKSNALTNKAIVAFNNGNRDSAYVFFQKSLQLRLALGSSRPIVDSYFNLASFNIMINDYSSAKSYIDTALLFAERNGLKIEQIDLIELLAEVNKLENNISEVQILEVKLDSLRNLQEYNSQIDPISTGVVSVMLNSHDTLPIDPEEGLNSWIFQLIGVLTLLIFSGGILLFLSKKI